MGPGMWPSAMMPPTRWKARTQRQCFNHVSGKTHSHRKSPLCQSGRSQPKSAQGRHMSAITTVSVPGPNASAKRTSSTDDAMANLRPTNPTENADHDAPFR